MYEKPQECDLHSSDLDDDIAPFLKLTQSEERAFWPILVQERLVDAATILATDPGPPEPEKGGWRLCGLPVVSSRRTASCLLPAG